MVTVLVGIWALVPLHDKASSQERPSPLYTDLAVAALIFLSYLTLKAWDIGGMKAGAVGLPDPRATSWVCALIILAVSACVVTLRALAYRHRWFILSGAEVVHVILNGVVGLDYLLAGLIATVLAIAGIAFDRRRARAAGGGAP